MTKLKKILTIGASVTVTACMALTASGCGFLSGLLGPLMSIDELGQTLAAAMLGNDAYSLNVLTVSPKETFGIERTGDAEWYGYSAVSSKDLKQSVSAFKMLRTELKKHKLSELNEKDAATYRTLEYTLNTYIDYYDSKYAADFILIGGDYINSFGGYVADFASMFENFTFRTEDDVIDLLDMTKSTRTVFSTYLDYAADRKSKGYPLYDYSVCAMQDYLDDVTEQGDEYYLYTVAQNKIDGASCLNSVDKAHYKAEYEKALKQNFMPGVSELSKGLDKYKGNVTATEKSYLAQYGEMGRAYYKWKIENSTGMSNVDISKIYNQTRDMAIDYDERQQEILEQVKAAENTDPELYNTFNSYLNGETVLLGLTDPEEIIEYLKESAKNIVPDLATTPDIDVKYMDRTAGEISNVMAYYLLSPLDDFNSAEHITLNSYRIEQDSSELLTTIAHEGYPGHLYAHVNAKESGMNMLTLMQRCSTFAEGWAMYAEFAVLHNIAAETDDPAIKLFCEYRECEEVTGYLNIFLLDMQVNYMGMTVSDFASSGMDKDTALRYVEWLMEMPANYVTYGYGTYVMLDIHDRAKLDLGDNYDEVEFNGYLLSEGMGPTIPRTIELTSNYIAKKK